MAATDHVLDALALVEARLEHRDGDLTYLLDHCENPRAVAVILADAFAQHLESTTPDPLAALAQVRRAVIGEPPAAGGASC
jgi:hypothetical protein